MKVGGRVTEATQTLRIEREDSSTRGSRTEGPAEWRGTSSRVCKEEDPLLYSLQGNPYIRLPLNIQLSL